MRRVDRSLGIPRRGRGEIDFLLLTSMECESSVPGIQCFEAVFAEPQHTLVGVPIRE